MTILSFLRAGGDPALIPTALRTPEIEAVLRLPENPTRAQVERAVRAGRAHWLTIPIAMHDHALGLLFLELGEDLTTFPLSLATDPAFILKTIPHKVPIDKVHPVARTLAVYRAFIAAGLCVRSVVPDPLLPDLVDDLIDHDVLLRLSQVPEIMRTEARARKLIVAGRGSLPEVPLPSKAFVLEMIRAGKVDATEVPESLQGDDEVIDALVAKESIFLGQIPVDKRTPARCRALLLAQCDRLGCLDDVPEPSRTAEVYEAMLTWSAKNGVWFTIGHVPVDKRTEAMFSAEQAVAMRDASMCA